jgi:flagellar hook-associated protein 3 FlgL
MRVTNGMIRNNMINSLNNNMMRLDTLYSQMNTLKKIQRPSDDPIITGRSLKLKVNVLEVAQYKNNTEEATSWMSVTEKALGNFTEILSEISKKCVNASTTGSLGTDDIQKLQVDINQLFEQLQQEANVTYIGRYVFSGYKTDEPVVITEPTKLTNNVTVKEAMTLPKGTELAAGTVIGGVAMPAGPLLVDTNVAPPDVLAGNTILQKGTINPNVLGNIDGQNIQYEVGVGSTIVVNTLGMDDVTSKLFTAIKEIKDGLDAHSGGTPADLDFLHGLFTNKIQGFADIASDISEMTADLGSRMARLDYTASRLTDDKANFTELLSNTEDVDLEEIYTEFNAQYAVYQSALQATSKVIMNTLADFLR